MLQNRPKLALLFASLCSIANECRSEQIASNIEPREVLMQAWGRLATLQKGQCTISGTEQKRHGAALDTFVIQFAFDFTRPSFKIIREDDGQLLLTEDYVYARGPSWEGMVQRSVDFPGVSFRAERFELRTFPLYGKPPMGLERLGSHFADFEPTEERIRQASDFSMATENGRVRLSFTLPGGAFDPRFHVWIDPDRGFTIWRCSTGEDFDTTTETEWSEVNGWWVPIRIRTRSVPGVVMRHGDLTIEWASVNEDLDEQIFSVSSLVPAGEEGSLIVNPPEGEVRPIEVARISNFPVDSPSTAPAGSVPAIADSQAIRTPVSTILMMAGVLLASVGGFLFIRTRPSKR